MNDGPPKKNCICTVGYGRFGKHHANVLKHHPNAAVEAICETDHIALKQARVDFPDAKIYTEPINMLQEIKVDAVSVAVSYTHLTLPTTEAV